MRRISGRYVVAYVVACDVLLVFFALPFERYALAAAAAPETGAPLILALLILNVLLLVTIVAAALASCGLTARFALGAASALRRKR